MGNLQAFCQIIFGDFTPSERLMAPYTLLRHVLITNHGPNTHVGTRMCEKQRVDKIHFFACFCMQYNYIEGNCKAELRHFHLACGG